MELSILYRGPLSSCNYGCEYCPFAKRVESREELAVDEAALERFVGWIAARPASDRIAVLFTPWGEALIRPAYQRALARLTQLPQITRAAIQTNLSARLDFVDACAPGKLGIWATYHPEWTSREAYVAKVSALHARGVQVSAGVVGFNRFKPEIAELRRELPDGVYLWINAAKKEETYTDEDVRFFAAIDPLFPVNTIEHPSRGKRCGAGSRAISVDGDGTVRSCHFVRAPLGNLYDPAFESVLAPRLCPNDTCGCHIGYVHLEELALGEVFGAGILERVPLQRIW
jgi:MoaA/NifB/PqqE/SkfB family radical SAM enzyme